MIEQKELRLKGESKIYERRVSLKDIEEREIRRGRERKRKELGYKARVEDKEEGLVIVEIKERGKQNDDGLLDDAIAKATPAGMQIRAVLEDGVFANAVADDGAGASAVRERVITRGQREARIERTRGWRRRYRYRNGIEGRISQLKRKGLGRTRLRRVLVGRAAAAELDDVRPAGAPGGHAALDDGMCVVAAPAEDARRDRRPRAVLADRQRPADPAGGRGSSCPSAGRGRCGCPGCSPCRARPSRARRSPRHRRPSASSSSSIVTRLVALVAAAEHEAGDVEDARPSGGPGLRAARRRRSPAITQTGLSGSSTKPAFVEKLCRRRGC